MKPYFQRVEELSPTMFWINNPTRRQADLALEHGARAALKTHLSLKR